MTTLVVRENTQMRCCTGVLVGFFNHLFFQKCYVPKVNAFSLSCMCGFLFERSVCSIPGFASKALAVISILFPALHMLEAQWGKRTLIRTIS